MRYELPVIGFSSPSILAFTLRQIVQMVETSQGLILFHQISRRTSEATRNLLMRDAEAGVLASVVSENEQAVFRFQTRERESLTSRTCVDNAPRPP